MNTTEETVERRVIKVIAEELVIDVEQVVATARFAGDLGADELDMSGITMSLEDEFGLIITESEAARFLTVKDVLDFIAMAV